MFIFRVVLNIYLSNYFSITRFAKMLKTLWLDCFMFVMSSYRIYFSDFAALNLLFRILKEKFIYTSIYNVKNSLN